MSEEKKELMSKSEAYEKIISWAEHLEIDHEAEGFQDVIDEIQFAVRKEKLTYNFEDCSFKYVLKSPIQKKDADTINIVTISEMTMQQKEVIQRFKDNESITRSIALISAALSIESGFAGRIKDRDSGIINAVIMGFYMGAGK